MAKKEYRRKRTKSFLSGFKDFVMKGNILDLAIGVVIGAAFGKIVTSLVNDVIMPPISLLLGNQELADAKWILQAEVLNAAGAVQTAEVALRYGSFLMLIFEFLIIAFAIYTAVTLIIRRKQFNDKVAAELKAKEAKEEPVKEEVAVIPQDILLLEEIRDLLKEKA